MERLRVGEAVEEIRCECVCVKEWGCKVTGGAENNWEEEEESTLESIGRCSSYDEVLLH